MQGNPHEETGAKDPAAVERAAKLVASLGQGLESADEVFAAFEQLDALPPEVVRDALVALTGESATLDDLDDATRVALGMPPKPVVLLPIAIVRDADVLDLGRLVEAQVRAAGETWDGENREAFERLDGESEGSFAGTLERLVLAPVPASASIPDVTKPAFDVLLFQRDAGAIFESGTTKRVGAIAYGTVEMGDRRARAAVQTALAWAKANPPTSTPYYLPGAEPKPEPVEPAPETVAAPPDRDSDAVSSAVPTRRVEVPKQRKFTQESFPWGGGEEPAAAKKKSAAKKKAAETDEAAPKKTTAKKKAAAKKEAPKKAAAKKEAPKKEAPKKAAAKKEAPKKAAAKKEAPKKAAAKKEAPKKAAAKKEAPKKAAAKKAASKKEAPKKAAAKKASPTAKRPLGKKAASKKAVAKVATTAKRPSGKKAAAKKVAAPKTKTVAKKAAAKKKR